MRFIVDHSEISRGYRDNGEERRNSAIWDDDGGTLAGI